MDPAEILWEARRRHGVGQRSLARRAGTSQAQISRIERGEISPSFETMTRLLSVMGERPELRSAPIAGGNRSTRELAADYADLTPGERVAQAAALSHAATSLAAARRSS